MPKQVVDRHIVEQTSSKEVQQIVAQSPSMSQGTKRRYELELDPPTSKHARQHTDSKQPHQSICKAFESGDQSRLSQKSVDNLKVLHSVHQPTGTQDHAELVAVPEPNGTVSHAPLTIPPKASANTTLRIPPVVLGKSTLIRDRLQFLPDDAYFLHLSRVKCALEDTINSDEGVPWVTRFPEAPRMISKINVVLEDMSYCVKRSELDFGAREWSIWCGLDRTVERRRMDGIRKPKGKGT